MKWKDVKDYEGVYQVSDTGKVRRVGECRNQHTSWKSKNVLSPGDNGSGYLKVNLSKNNKVKMFYVHRLVGKAFLPKPEEGRNQINHKDGDKSNNCVNNLEWMNNSENNKHSYDNLDRKTLKNNPKVSKPVIKLDKEGNILEKYPSVREASRQTGVSSGGISAVCRDKRKTAGGYKWQFQKV